MKGRKNGKDFAALDLHDDGLIAIRIFGLDSKFQTTRIELELRDDSTERTKILSFSSCANLRYIMDFDVLAANWFAQTEGTSLTNDPNRKAQFVRGQRRHWRVKYMSPQPNDRPILKKLSAIREYRLYKVTFFGGTIEVLAKSFALTTRRA
jgi:hypothetical protein